MSTPSIGDPRPPTPSNSSTARKRSRAAGWIWLLFGIGLMALGILGSFAVPAALDVALHAQDSPVFGVFGYIAMVVLFSIGIKCYLLGRRYLALSTQELLANDPRPPVLYLRSFGADKKAAKIPTGGILRYLSYYTMFSFKTEEELIAQAFSEIGPVVCIGKPGEKLPELGAARVYVGHDQWQQTVHDYMAGSSLVVLRAGDTPGFWWEVERAVKFIDPARLVFLIPFGRRKYREFAQKAAQFFPHPLPEYRGRRNFLGIRYTRGLGTLRGLIYFQPDWTPQYVDLVSIHWPWKMTLRFISRRRILQKLKCGLQPVFAQVGVPWIPPKARPVRGTFALLGGAALVFTLAVLAYIAVAGTIIGIRSAMYEAGYKRALASYIQRVQSSPQVQVAYQEAHGSIGPFDDTQAELAGEELAGRGLLRLDSDELAERANLYIAAASEAAPNQCGIITGGVQQPSFQEILKLLTPDQTQAWFRIQGDAVIAQAQNDPPLMTLTADQMQAAAAAIRDQFVAEHGENYLSSTLNVISSQSSNSDAVHLLNIISPPPDTDGWSYLSYERSDLCLAMKELQKAALDVPPPQRDNALRLMVLAEQ